MMSDFSCTAIYAGKYDLVSGHCENDIMTHPEVVSIRV